MNARCGDVTNMATLHSFKDDSTACFANVRMDDGKPVYISVAQSGVIVKCSRLGLFGQKLFKSKNVEHAVKVASALEQTFPDYRTPALMSNLVLKAYCNAVLHCWSVDEVAKVMNQQTETP